MEQHSFVIPTYKESPYLENCIISLLQQTVKSKIVICTSTPNEFTESLAHKYQLEYIVNPNKPGIASDWNFALANAHTSLVTIAHQDDVYAKTYTASILSQINLLTNKNVLLAFTQYNDLVNGQERKSSLNAVVKSILLFPFLFKNHIQSVFFKKALLAFGDPIGCPTVTLNMKLLKDFSFSTKYSCILDWFAWYELAARKGSFLYIKQPLMQHRIHVHSETTHQINTGKRKAEEQELFSIIWGKPIARLLTAIYALGHKQNEV